MLGCNFVAVNQWFADILKSSVHAVKFIYLNKLFKGHMKYLKLNQFLKLLCSLYGSFNTEIFCFFYGILFNMAIHGLNTDFYQYETSSFEKDTVIYCS